jgi:hypothetical protein
MLRTSVPEASVQEDRDSGTGEHKVGPKSSVTSQGREVHAIAKPRRVDDSPNG